MLHPAIEPPHTLYYRLVTPTGVIHSLEHVILATSEGAIRTEVRLVDKAEATKGFLPTIYLQTISIQHDLKLKKDSTIQFPQAQRLAPILKEIKECLREEGIDSDIELARAAFEPVCSLCDASLFIPSTFTLTFTGLTLARTDLDALVNEDHSLSRGWCAITLESNAESSSQRRTTRCDWRQFQSFTGFNYRDRPG